MIGAMASCEHLTSRAGAAPDARTPEGCEKCLAGGTEWVHLRLCVDCGHVGCCDSSPMHHASKHYQQTEHPVAASYQPGESWRWCFADQVVQQ